MEKGARISTDLKEEGELSDGEQEDLVENQTKMGLAKPRKRANRKDLSNIAKNIYHKYSSSHAHGHGKHRSDNYHQKSKTTELDSWLPLRECSTSSRFRNPSPPSSVDYYSRNYKHLFSSPSSSTGYPPLLDNSIGTHLKKLSSSTKYPQTPRGYAERFVPPKFRSRSSLHVNIKEENGTDETDMCYTDEPPPPGTTPPPLSNHETSDYGTLLKQFNFIKERLESLQQEEERGTEILSDAIPVDKNGNARGDGEEEDDDLNILELRLAALASAARASRQGLENESPAKSTPTPTPVPKKKMVKKQVERKPRNQDTSTGNRSKSRHTVAHKSAKIAEAEEIERTRRECQKILTMDDPAEQYRRFLLFAQKQVTPSTLLRGKGKDKKVEDGVLHDNYEPVEMELDSDVSSTADIQINNQEAAYYPEMPDASMSFIDPVPMYQPSYLDPMYLSPPPPPLPLGGPDVLSFIPQPPQTIPLPPSPVPEHPPMPPEEDMPSPPPPPPPLEAPPLPQAEPVPPPPPKISAKPPSIPVYIPTPIKRNIEEAIIIDEPYSPGSPTTDYSKAADTSMESVIMIEDSPGKDIIEIVTIDEDTEEESEVEGPGRVVKDEVIDIEEDTQEEEEVPKGVEDTGAQDADNQEDEDEEGEIHDDDMAEEEEEDLDCLRAKLLETVASRRRQKLQEQEERMSRESSQSPTVTTNDVPMRKVVITSQPRRNQPLNKTHLPVHDRVVVHLGDEGSESEEEQQPKLTSTSNFSLGLDQFLKEVRQSVETSKSEKEKAKAKKPAKKIPIVYRSVERKQSQSPANTSTSKKGTRTDLIRITVQNDPKDQEGNQSPAAIVSYDTEMTAEMEEGRFDDVEMSEDDAYQVPLQNAREILDIKFQQYKADLEKQRKTVVLEETRHRALASQIGKRKMILLVAEKKVQKLREQLIATERLVLMGREEIYKLTMESSTIATTVKDRKKNITKLEAELSELGTHLYGKDLHATKRKPQTPVTGGPVVKKARPMPIKSANDAALAAAVAKKKKMDLARAKERQRLHEMKDHLAEMIRQFKEQAKTKKPEVKPPQIEEPPPPPPPPIVDDVFSVLKNQDKILLESGEGSEKKDIGAVNIDEFRVRRKSLLNLNQSFKPDLEPDSSLANTAASGGLDKTSSDGRPEKVDKATKLGGTSERSQSRSRTATPDPIGAKTLQVKLPNKQKRMQLEKLILKTSQPLLHHSGPYEAIHKFLPPVSQMEDIKLDTTSKDSSKPLSSNKSASYKSALTCFRGYRLNKFFRTKECIPLSSPVIANKVNPELTLCRFSLDGICNDEKCPWQHIKDYQLSHEEILQDIVSYCPKLAGVTDDTPQESYSKLICDYVDTFIKQNKVRVINQNDMCLLLISRVNAQLGNKHPYSTPQTGRMWRPTQTEKLDMDSEDEKMETAFQKSDSADKRGLQTQLSVNDLDNIISENDVRYFMYGTEAIQDLEAEVLEDKENAILWLKLAYKKLYSENESPSSCLDQALNVLARALEQNKSSSELWQHYLSLYRRRGDLSDMKDLCQHALRYAPSYKIWWEYLNISTSCEGKRDICQKVITFLGSSLEIPYEKYEEHSHQLLEILLYQVAIMTQSGKLKTGQQLLQNALSGTLLEFLSPKDRGLVWLAYIHLIEFHHIPPQLFDPVNSNPGKIVAKEPFLIPWHTVSKLRSTPEHLIEQFTKAIASCTSQTSCNLTKCVLPLERNLANLLVFLGRIIEAKQRFEDLIQLDPKNEEVWFAYAATVVDGENGVNNAKEVVFQGLVENPCSAKLTFSFAQLAYSQGYRDQVIGLLVEYINGIFKMDKSGGVTYNPIMLYNKCLGLPVPNVLPPFVDNLDQYTLKESTVYIWLNFCFLVALQGDEAQTIDLYETAISALTDLKDIQTVWLCYLRYRLSCVEASPPATKQKDFKSFSELVSRCLTSMPSRFPLPHRPDCTWVDYTYHNEVIDLYVRLLTEENVFKAYEKFTQMMPTNVGLIIRYLQCLMKSDHNTQAKLLASSAVIYDKCSNLGLAKCAVGLIKKKSELRKFFKKVTHLLPYAITLWKDVI